MPTYITWGLLAVALALVAYTWGIWGPHRGGDIRLLHVVLLWVGLLLDSVGTGLMAAKVGYYRLDVHGVIGTVAIALMAASAVWATYAHWVHDTDATSLYVRWGVWVWAFWLLPYLYVIVYNITANQG